MRAPRCLHGSPGICALVSLLLAAADARAQSSNAVLAESLYQSGKQLFEKGDYAAACPKLAESDRLDPAGGTILMLALCYEGEGKTASAYVAFGEAKARASHDGRDDRARLAKTHLEALEPKLPRLVIEVPDAVRAIPGLVVKSGGVVVPSVSYDVAVFADPGNIAVSAEASGFEPFRATASVRAGETAHIRVGSLAPIPRPAPAPPVVAAPEPAPSAPPLRPSRGAPVAALTLGALGVAALGVGGYFGVTAINDSHTVRDQCHGASTCSDSSAVDLAHRANTEANVANITLPLGGAALAAGVVVFLLGRSPQDPRSSLRISPWIGRGPGLTLEGAL
jgi:hypothetical protein